MTIRILFRCFVLVFATKAAVKRKLVFLYLHDLYLKCIIEKLIISHVFLFRLSIYNVLIQGPFFAFFVMT